MASFARPLRTPSFPSQQHLHDAERGSTYGRGCHIINHEPDGEVCDHGDNEGQYKGHESGSDHAVIRCHLAGTTAPASSSSATITTKPTLLTAGTLVGPEPKTTWLLFSVLRPRICGTRIAGCEWIGEALEGVQSEQGITGNSDPEVRAVLDAVVAGLDVGP